MRSFRCPTCNQWIWVPNNTVDFNHRCHKSGGSAYTSRKKEYFPGQTMQRVFENGYEDIGADPPSPNKKLTSKKKEEVIRGDKRQVYTDINLR